MADDEFAAFQAELTKLEAPTPGAAASPRAPQVISAAPSGPTITKVSRAPTGPLPVGTPTVGGARLPVSQWPKPDQLVSSIQQDYPNTAMPELVRAPCHPAPLCPGPARTCPHPCCRLRPMLPAPPAARHSPLLRGAQGKQPGTLMGAGAEVQAAETRCMPSGVGAASSSAQPITAAAALSSGRLQPGHTSAGGQRAVHPA